MKILVGRVRRRIEAKRTLMAADADVRGGFGDKLYPYILVVVKQNIVETCIPPVDEELI